jgi:hypothetical protein
LIQNIDGPAKQAPQIPDEALTYQQYRSLIEKLAAEGKSTGNLQTESLTNYSRLNIQRMKRIDKTISILPALEEAIQKISQPLEWLVITEGWCGDAAQLIPLFHALARLNPAFRLSLILRDEHPLLMDQYLTNGKSRSIPKLVVSNPASGLEIFNWGPRPKLLQDIYDELRQENISKELIAETLHGWYAKDRTISAQQEILSLLSGQIGL